MKTCVVCGARVNYRNTNTCDKICNAAKLAKRSRYEQLRWEVEHPSDLDMRVAASMRDRYETLTEDYDVNLGDEP